MNTTDSAAAVSGDPAAAAIMIQAKTTGSSRPSGRLRPPSRGRGSVGTTCATGCAGGGRCGRSAPSTGSTGRSEVSSRRSVQVLEAYAADVRSSNSSSVSRPSVYASLRTSTTLSRSLSDARIGRSVIGGPFLVLPSILTQQPGEPHETGLPGGHAGGDGPPHPAPPGPGLPRAVRGDGWILQIGHMGPPLTRWPR